MSIIFNQICNNKEMLPKYTCDILTLDPAVNQETGASDRRYRRYHLNLWTG